MKLILFIAVVSFSSVYGLLRDEHYGDFFLNVARQLHNKCVPITGVTQDKIDGLKNGVFADDEKLKRYVLCLWIVSEEMNPDLSMHIEKLTKAMPKKITNGVKMYVDCAKQAERSGITEPHERVYKMVKCYYDADPENFIMF
nr:general odorant-binding protein 83a-like [Leptinotarsa decemlineata]XP_023029860.1 general odorant-binding protein 83a-like [Leptinotarsa decemlineata]